jgi:hypothetical protein
VDNEIEICAECLIGSGYVQIGSSIGGENPVPCAVCGKEYWVIPLAVLVNTDNQNAVNATEVE